MEKVILNSKGEKVLLNAQEQAMADANQLVVNSYKNAMGLEVDITTLTQIIKSISEQKFFQIAPADFLPISVGEGAWSTNLTKFRSFSVADDFSTGIIKSSSHGARQAETTAGVDTLNVPVYNWAKTNTWSLIELNTAARQGNWDLITHLEKARKTNWDLGIQEVAFLGLKNDTNVKGLFTQTAVNSNTALITKYIKSMTSAEFNTFVVGIYEAYRVNCARTAKPTHFIIPEADYNGLIGYPDATYPLKTKLELLTDAFKTITGNQNFKILPNAYADKANNADVTALNKNRYTLLNYDADSVVMNIPVDYTSTMANSINNFNFQNAAYGQFTGTLAIRDKEMLYFDFT